MQSNQDLTKELPDRDISSFAFLKGFAIGNRYEIIDKLGSGGMGLVYKAVDKHLDETVVLKILLQQLTSDATFLERFKREVLLTRKVTHPNVIRVHDIGEVGNILYISMEYFEGIDLDTKLRRVGALPHNEAIHILKQICAGLEVAHRLEIVHRDVKPRNILLDEKNFVKIIDFGLARSLDLSGLTMKDDFIGTPYYMSPEQIITPDKVDYRTDIYSLGVLMYEMFTGQLPFESDTPVSAAFKHVKERPPLPKSVNPNVPEWIENIILRALEKNPDKRFQSAREVARYLEAGLVEPDQISFDKPKYSHVEVRPVLLSVSKRKLVEKIYVFAKPLVTLGRHKEADLVLRLLPRNERNDHRSMMVGKVHAFIRCDGENFIVKDLDSRNGTYVRGRELQPGAEALLDDKSLLSLGGVLDLRFDVFRDPEGKIACGVLRRIHNLPQEKYVLVMSEIRFGSNGNNPITLDGDRVADTQARIFLEGGVFWIENLVDTPKIYLDDVRLAANHFEPINPPAVIRMGDAEIAVDTFGNN